MTLRFFWLTAGAVLALAGCASHTPAPTATPMTTSAAVTAPLSAIELERSACFGTCPAYSLRLQADGSVQLQDHGSRSRPAGQPPVVHQGQFPAAELARIQAQLQALQFMQLNERYATVQDGCAAVATDFPSLRITAHYGAQTKSVRYYQGCHGLALGAQLSQLATLIDEVGQSRQWLGH